MAVGAGLVTAGLLTTVAPVAASAAPYRLEPATHRVVFTIDDPRITESSSLVVSTMHPGLAYTANDSGDGPHVYVLDHTGALVGTTTLAGVDPVDAEAMAEGGGSLVVGDIGDNDAVRSSVQVYRIPEPGRGDHTVTARRLVLTYANGPHNAEAMLYDATTGRVYVITKEVFGRVYATGPDVFARSSAVLRPVAYAPPIATDATLLPGDHVAVVRTYGTATAYRFPSWRRIDTFDLPAEQQGESIAAVPGRNVVWVGSEGEHSRVLEVPLPARVTALASAGSAGSAGSSESGTETEAPAAGSSAFVRFATSGAVIAILAGLVVWLSRTAGRLRTPHEGPEPGGRSRRQGDEHGEVPDRR